MADLLDTDPVREQVADHNLPDIFLSAARAHMENPDVARVRAAAPRATAPRRHAT